MSDEQDKTRLMCFKPFQWFELGWNKQAYSCCSGWVTQSIGRMPEQSALEIWRSEAARAMRASVLDGSFKYCKSEYCPHLRDLSGPVARKSEAFIKEFSRFVEEPELPKRLNCSYDVSCNLACPSCRTEIKQSSRSEREANDALFASMLKELGAGLEVINITGSGDPFASRHFWHMLTKGGLEQYPNLRIRLHTNGQLLDAKHWEKMESIHQQISAIEISFDGASKETFEANRFPANWEKQLANLKFIAEARKRGAFEMLQTDFVVQANNWHQMKDFIKLSLDHHVDHVRFMALNNWGTFTEEQYRAMAVHRPEHPQHQAMLEMLRDPIFRLPQVGIGMSDALKNYVEGSAPG
jgi:molybdenum cofactor biosynthesis enzyme MoaA